jgi:hypothetical protein
MMDITIYQIDPDRDQKSIAFVALDHLEKWQGSSEIDAGIYGKAFEGEVEADDLEGIYEIFNLDKPDGFHGRSMSVSDVVAVHDPKNGTTDYFYCDAIGFRKIDFDESRAAETFKEKITVVLCEPGDTAKVVQIGTELEDLQRAVDGMIETYYPFEDDNVCIVCNDEGKINGSRPNRAIYGEDGRMADLICGKFFICDCSTERFQSLPDDMMEKYKKQFLMPERFCRINGKILAVKYDPAKEEAR